MNYQGQLLDAQLYNQASAELTTRSADNAEVAQISVHYLCQDAALMPANVPQQFRFRGEDEITSRTR